jgi:hypothetical protein
VVLILELGEKKARKYVPLNMSNKDINGQIKDIIHETFKLLSQNLHKFLDTPPHARKKRFYNYDVLDSYVSNKIGYAAVRERKQRFNEGKRFYKV